MNERNNSQNELNIQSDYVFPDSPLKKYEVKKSQHLSVNSSERLNQPKEKDKDLMQQLQRQYLEDQMRLKKMKRIQ